MDLLVIPWVDKTIAIVASLPFAFELYRRWVVGHVNFPRAVLGLQLFNCRSGSKFGALLLCPTHHWQSSMQESAMRSRSQRNCTLIRIEKSQPAPAAD
jgi:hypothetical protein